MVDIVRFQTKGMKHDITATKSFAKFEIQSMGYLIPQCSTTLCLIQSTGMVGDNTRTFFVMTWIFKYGILLVKIAKNRPKSIFEVYKKIR